MDVSHKGTSGREQAFPRSAFLAYHSVIAHRSVVPTEGADPEERITCKQWEAECPLDPTDHDA